MAGADIRGAIGNGLEDAGRNGLAAAAGTATFRPPEPAVSLCCFTPRPPKGCGDLLCWKLYAIFLLFFLFMFIILFSLQMF
jgi:hypothetical protein